MSDYNLDLIVSIGKMKAHTNTPAKLPPNSYNPILCYSFLQVIYFLKYSYNPYFTPNNPSLSNVGSPALYNPVTPY